MALSLLVFVSGAAVMVLEIVGSRFFAPYIGTSVVVWTSLIGIVMAGLSVGYALGGRLGDQWRSLPRLRMIVASAGCWTLLLPLVRDPLLLSLTATTPSLVIVALLGATLLLAPPSVLLGMVSPYAVRLAAHDIAHVGRVAGFLTALSTVGSIVGVFLAGFVFLPLLGTDAILVATAVALSIVAALPLTRRSASSVFAFLLLVVFVLALGVRLRDRVHAAQRVWERRDTPYSVVRVRELPGYPSDRPVLLLEIDGGAHAAIFTDGGPGEVFPHIAFYRLIDAVRPDVMRGLLLGGGGYTVAQDFLARHLQARLDVVEIDPVVTEVAAQYFGLRPDPRLAIVHEDARTFLNRGGPPAAPGEGRGSYQVVFGDAFRSLFTIPFHLTTLEAVQRIADLLDDRGVYLANIIASRLGRRTTILRSFTRTLEQVFPSVLVFEAPNVYEPEGNDPWTIQNFILLASKAPLTLSDLDARGRRDLADILRHVVDPPLDLSPYSILTDDYAPVEAMLNL